MRSSTKMVVVGLLMVAVGGYLFFGGATDLPLWVVWLMGPFLWYVGGAILGVGLFYRLFMPKPEPQHREVKIVAPARPRLNQGPVCLVHEVPPMGGFLY